MNSPRISIIIPLPDHRGHALAGIGSWLQQSVDRAWVQVVVIVNGGEPELESSVAELLGPHDLCLSLEGGSLHDCYNAGAQAALFALVKVRDRKAVQSTNTGQALIDEIMFNRRIELWGEGFRFTDLKRLNLPLNRNGIPNHLTALITVRDIPAGDPQWEWLFPQDELNTNKAIVQNPL